jgi:hypothetical protein
MYSAGCQHGSRNLPIYIPDNFFTDLFPDKCIESSSRQIVHNGQRAFIHLEKLVNHLNETIALQLLKSIDFSSPLQVLSGIEQFHKYFFAGLFFDPFEICALLKF